MAAAVVGLSVAAVVGQSVTYTLFTPDGRRTFSVRTNGSTEVLALDQLAQPFGLTFTEDRLAGGLVIGTRRDRIVAVPGQSFIQVAGRVVGLDAPIQRDRNVWTASLDFLTKALGPAIGEPVVVRRSSRMVIVGNVRVPQISARVERTTAGARILMAIQPPAPHQVARDGARLVVRFDAAALDVTPITGFIPEFVTGARIDGASFVIDLGPSAAGFRTEDTTEALVIELLSPPPVPSPAPVPGPAAPRPAPFAIDTSPGLRVVVLDPGHGGDDTGTKGDGGTVEKDITLQLARRLKAAIEARLGLRVLLTRDADDTVSLDSRTAFANHNKADLFISLHVNGSPRPAARGAQVYVFDAASGAGPAPAADPWRRTVPVLGGGTRVIDPMPWEQAQRPFAEDSAAFGAALVRHFTERGVGLSARPLLTAPMRVLASANMPAVLIEFAFLTNAADEAALARADSQAAMIDAVVAALADLRRTIHPSRGVSFR